MSSLHQGIRRGTTHQDKETVLAGRLAFPLTPSTHQPNHLSCLPNGMERQEARNCSRTKAVCRRSEFSRSGRGRRLHKDTKCMSLAACAFTCRCGVLIFENSHLSYLHVRSSPRTMPRIRSEVRRSHVRAPIRQQKHNRGLVVFDCRHTAKHIPFRPQRLQLRKCFERRDSHGRHDVSARISV